MLRAAAPRTAVASDRSALKLSARREDDSSEIGCPSRNGCFYEITGKIRFHIGSERITVSMSVTLSDMYRFFHRYVPLSQSYLPFIYTVSLSIRIFPV